MTGRPASAAGDGGRDQPGQAGEDPRDRQQPADVGALHHVGLTLEEVKGRGVPEWISPEGELGGKVVSMPTREQINLPVQEQLIVELYSK